MIKKIAWDAFKNTGNIDTFLEYKQIQSLEEDIKDLEQIQKIVDINVDGIKENSNGKF